MNRLALQALGVFLVMVLKVGERPPFWCHDLNMCHMLMTYLYVMLACNEHAGTAAIRIDPNYQAHALRCKSIGC